ncbi:hypothetical protein BC567DRAFT_220998 [Phyllosticta citribraziliensis]
MHRHSSCCPNCLSADSTGCSGGCCALPFCRLLHPHRRRKIDSAHVVCRGVMRRRSVTAGQ